MVVLSLFDGMSCGQIALRELAVPIESYYASEIDKHAIAQTAYNFPETIQMGDVRRWRDWAIDWSSIDLILAGSPCQGFSLAGQGLAFEDERSRLFWDFVHILRHTQKHNPRVRYLLENVRMRSEHEFVISNALGIEPIIINSALVSAQNRVRLYWTDIKTESVGLFGERIIAIPQPRDRGVVLRDILEDEVDSKYYLKKVSPSFRGMSIEGKGRTLRVGGHTSQDDGHNYDIISLCTELEDLAIYQRGRGYNKGGVHQTKSPTLTSCDWEHNHVVGGTWRSYKKDRGFRPMEGNKSPCLMARGRENGDGQACVQLERVLRRLTPRECSRLQTIPEWYEWRCSDSQAYKMLGNGWTVEVIKHILQYLV